MKYIPYSRQCIYSDDIQAVIDVLKSDYITQGPKVDEFEGKVAFYCGAKFAVAVSSGTAALHIACLASGLKKGDEAITSPITFLATPNSIFYTQAMPIFTDIDANTINIDPEKIEKEITKRTKIILPVHFAGLPCDMEKISCIARKNNLGIIEDASHALGAEYKLGGKWNRVGSCSHSDMTVFSFHPVKHIATGEGGIITTNSKKLYEKLKALRSHGVYRDTKTAGRGAWYYEMRDLGFNYRITDFQCALGISQLKKIDRFIKIRREIAWIYNKKLSKIKEIGLPNGEKDYLRSAWHLYVIRLKAKLGVETERKKIFNYLRKNNVGVQVHYIPVYLQPFYQKLGFKKGICPNAEAFYRSAISIPLYQSMKDRDVRSVIKIISGIF